jgi:hypothetical protein
MFRRIGEFPGRKFSKERICSRKLAKKDDLVKV